MVNTSSACDKGGKDDAAMHAPERLTSPHQRTVYGRDASMWANSFSLMVGFLFFDTDFSS